MSARTNKSQPLVPNRPTKLGQAKPPWTMPCAWCPSKFQTWDALTSHRQSCVARRDYFIERTLAAQARDDEQFANNIDRSSPLEENL